VGEPEAGRPGAHAQIAGNDEQRRVGADVGVVDRAEIGITVRGAPASSPAAWPRCRRPASSQFVRERGNCASAVPYRHAGIVRGTPPTFIRRPIDRNDAAFGSCNPRSASISRSATPLCSTIGAAANSIAWSNQFSMP
jgi:hypothetical protein